jgi:hypothetical protein
VPTYTYRCPAGHYCSITHGMTEDPVISCLEFVPIGGASGPVTIDALATEPCDMRMSRVVVKPPNALISPREAPTALTRKRGLDKAEGYQAHLARFPGDPQAFTSGKVAKEKLIDQRLREGWVEVPRPRDQKLTGRPDGLTSAAERAAQKVKEGKVDIGEA